MPGLPAVRWVAVQFDPLLGLETAERESEVGVVQEMACFGREALPAVVRAGRVAVLAPGETAVVAVEGAPAAVPA